MQFRGIVVPLFGHAHDGYGINKQDGIVFSNAALLDDMNRLVRKPIHRATLLAASKQNMASCHRKYRKNENVSYLVTTQHPNYWVGLRPQNKKLCMPLILIIMK